MDFMQLILAAVTGAAGAIGSAPVSAALNDAYDKLKTLLVKKFGKKAEVEKAIVQLEARPASEPRKAVLSEELESSGAGRDEEIARLARELLEILHKEGMISETTYNAVIAGVIIQGEHPVVSGEGGISVGRDLNVFIKDPESLWQAIQERPPEKELRIVTEQYLKHLVESHRYLELKGMGISDRIPLKLGLMDMYVPLKARIEMPEGETWARDLRLAGRKVSAEEAEAMGRKLSEPRPVLDLFKEQDGLIILGDPGSGKTTFLKYLALSLALKGGDSLGLGARLPVLVPLSAYANALEKKDVPLESFLGRYYKNRNIDLPLEPMLKGALDRGGALVLLDGLDEVLKSAIDGILVAK